MAIKLEVWGDYALFTRPEFKTERVSYDVMTPSAARGILEAIYWHPGMVYRIDRIYVCSPIKWANMKRNEVSEKISSTNVKRAMKSGKGNLYIATSECIQQRSSMMLRDVHYVIEAHFEMTERASITDSPGKFLGILTRRLEKGQCYHQPCLGCRECTANVSACHEIPPCPDELKGTKDLGLMLYDMDYSDPDDIEPMFFRGILKDGVLEVPPYNSKEVLK